jgi:uncharacterized protein (TIGR02118 family)
MVKVLALIPRRPDIGEARFHEHWAGPHAELACRITTLRRYVQSHRIDPGVRGLPAAAYDGIAEVWFDDFATAAGMGEDPDYADYAHVDEPRFIDVDRLAFLMTEEDVVRAGPPVAKDAPGAKAMLLLRRNRGLSPDEIAGRLAELGPQLGELVPQADRVTVAVSLPETYADGAEPPFDAAVELWFSSVATFESSWEACEKALLDELRTVADLERSAGFLADELRVIWPEGAAAGAASA